jgi:ABC-type uncharacterized transport system auxiliary subunit
MDTKYYVLDYLPTPPKERLEKGPYPFSLRVRDCNIAEAYRRTQIVYRQSANQMQFYSYHMWAVDPDRMINDLAVKHLKAARLFENVTRAVESFVPDYYMGCDIQAIEEYDNKDQWFAHMAVEYSIEDAKTNQIVWKKLYDLRKKVAQQEPVYVVRELSSLLESAVSRAGRKWRSRPARVQVTDVAWARDLDALLSPDGVAVEVQPELPELSGVLAKFQQHMVPDRDPRPGASSWPCRVSH